MFDGTDLSMAYGSMYEMPPAPPQMAVNTHIPHTADLPLPKATASHAMAPQAEQQYSPPPAMYTQQQASRMSPQSDNFWDKLVAKKWDVIKLVVLSLVVLLGISMDKVVTHYLTGYISKGYLSDNQELVARMGYPVAVLLTLWVIKAAA